MSKCPAVRNALLQNTQPSSRLSLRGLKGPLLHSPRFSCHRGERSSNAPEPDQIRPHDRALWAQRRGLAAVTTQVVQSLEWRQSNDSGSSSQHQRVDQERPVAPNGAQTAQSSRYPISFGSERCGISAAFWNISSTNFRMEFRTTTDLSRSDAPRQACSPCVKPGPAI